MRPGGRKEVSDYEINGNVRRELVMRGLDLGELRYRCSGGAVELTGKLIFKEPKAPYQIIKELNLLEQAIGAIRGVKRVHMEFEDWQHSAGKWSKTVEAEEEEKKKAAEAGETTEGKS